MENKKDILQLVFTLSFYLIAFSLIVLSWSFLYTTTIHNEGTIHVIGLKTDIDFIDWGRVEPNSTTPRLINVQNSGNTNITISMYCSNWQPINASKYLLLSWNYTNQILEPSQWLLTEFTLTVSNNVTGIKHFSFDIWLIAHEIMI